MLRTFLLLLFFTPFFQLSGQDFTDTAQRYPLEVDGNKYIVSGFILFDRLSDDDIFANALLWTVENVCPKEQDGIITRDVKAKNFSCNLALGSMAGSGLENIYYCRVTFWVADKKLVYYISDILIESPVFVMKKVTPMEKLVPEKKVAHREAMDDFVLVESTLLNKLFDFVGTNPLMKITHWNEISIRKPVKGMTETECRLAFGKPQSILESNGEIQWMYNSSFHLFFRNGQVQTIIK